jgi:protein-S-isoprenylcysteine O-methyltransferase Ste14
MNGLSAVIRDLPTLSREAPSMAMGNDRLLVERGRSIRFRSVLVNTLVASFYGVFLYSSLKFWLKTGSLVGMGIVTFNTLAVMCLLTRRNASVVTGSVRNWILAFLTLVGPFLLRPVGSSSWSIILVSSAGQVVGLGIMIASVIVLNRSIGVVAANRGVKTRGPYAWIRHPLYAGEILFDLSFLLANWSYVNGILILALTFAQVVRSLQEESLLLRDERYVTYRAAVPHRLIPGLF